MERISIQSDSPGYIKVSEIGKELIAFSEIIEKKPVGGINLVRT